MTDVLTKPIKDMQDEEVRATEAYKALSSGALAGMISADALLSIARQTLSKIKQETSRFIIKDEVIEFLALAASKGLSVPAGGRLVLHPDGSAEVRGAVKAGGSRRFRWDADEHYPKLIGLSFEREISRAEEGKNGKYTLTVNKPLASRPDVSFALTLTSPNGNKVSYPARKKGSAGENETDDVSQLVAMSQWGAKVLPHAAFSLHEAEAFAAEREAAEDSDETEEVDEEDVGSLVEA